MSLGWHPLRGLSAGVNLAQDEALGAAARPTEDVASESHGALTSAKFWRSIGTETHGLTKSR